MGGVLSVAPSETNARQGTSASLAECETCLAVPDGSCAVMAEQKSLKVSVWWGGGNFSIVHSCPAFAGGNSPSVAGSRAAESIAAIG